WTDDENRYLARPSAGKLPGEVERDREHNGRSVLSAPPPRPDDRVPVPDAPPPVPGDRVDAPPRRFARPEAPAAMPHMPPPHPAQAEDTLFVRSRQAAQRATLPPPDAAQRVGVPLLPPPLAEHRVPDLVLPPRRGLGGPPWLAPALLAALGVLLIGAGIGFG